jgi:hypothetical protein
MRALVERSQCPACPRSADGTLRLSKEIGDLNVKSSGKFDDRRQGRAALAAENLRQVPFREIGLEVEAIQRAVFLDYDLAQPSAE